MATITDILPQIKDKNRVNLYLDGKFFCGLKIDTVLRERLKIGNIIEEDYLNKLQFESDFSKALDSALKLLSRMQKTEKQIIEYLKKKGYTDYVSDRVIEKLLEYRYLNDGDYSMNYVEQMSKTKGKRLIKMELMAKGVSADKIEEALDSIDSEETSCNAVAEKYLKNKDIKDLKVCQKTFKYLLSKGFSYDVAGKVMRNVKGLDEDF